MEPKPAILVHVAGGTEMAMLTSNDHDAGHVQHVAPDWLKRLKAAAMLPVILTMITLRPDLFEDDLD